MAYQFTQTAQELQYLFNEVEQLAGDYDGTQTYAVGDYCNYLGVVYKCTATTTGTFDAADWTSVVVMDEIEALTTSLTHVTDNGWSVIKFPDGRFEATRAETLNVGAGTAWGSGWYFHTTANLAMPACAATIQNIVATVYGSQLYVICGTASLGVSGAAFYVGNASAATGSVQISARIEGTYS